jgi:rhomboid protease GluP
MLSLHDLLRQRVREVPVTKLLVVINLLVFLAMLAGGAGLWHSSNGIQLAWGANFGPATQDGEWWRLGTAMFLHFGAIHLTLNLWALWACPLCRHLFCQRSCWQSVIAGCA